MSINIYIGNLSYQASEEDLRELFGEFGQIENVKIITDRETGRSKGFGFIEMQNDAEAEESIEELNGVMFQNRELVVNKARPRRERPKRRY